MMQNIMAGKELASSIKTEERIGVIDYIEGMVENPGSELWPPRLRFEDTLGVMFLERAVKVGEGIEGLKKITLPKLREKVATFRIFSAEENVKRIERLTQGGFLRQEDLDRARKSLEEIKKEWQEFLPRIEPETKAAKEEPVFTSEEKKKVLDLSKAQEKTAYAIFAINETRDGFQYKTWKEIANHVYQDKLNSTTTDEESSISDDERKKKEHEVTSRAITNGKGISEKLETINKTENVPPKLADFLGWVKKQPEYADLTINELMLIAQRSKKLKFEELAARAVQKEPEESIEPGEKKR